MLVTVDGPLLSMHSNPCIFVSNPGVFLHNPVCSCAGRLKHDNPLVVSHAYAVVAHFFNTTNSPELHLLQVRLTLTCVTPPSPKSQPLAPPPPHPQVFNSVLRAKEPDHRKALVREALDILIPLLHERRYVADPNTSSATQPLSARGPGPVDSFSVGGPSGSAGAGAGAAAAAAAAAQQQQQRWLRMLRKVLTEESSGGTAHVAHLWQVVLRHADVLYPHRALFVPGMAHAAVRWAGRQA